MDARGQTREPSVRNLVKLGGALAAGGLLFNALVTMAWHPSGEEDDHPAIFAEYAASDGWIATHFAQFLGVAVALGGLFVLCRALVAVGETNLLPRLGMGALIASVTAFAILQGLDGIGLKQAVDAWAGASGPEQELRFADAETVRWLEWGFQSFFRILLGLSLVLLGLAVVARPLVARWLGWLAVVAGVASIAIAIDVGYSGLEGSFQDTVSPLFQIGLLVFGIGLVVGTHRDSAAQAVPRDPAL